MITTFIILMLMPFLIFTAGFVIGSRIAKLKATQEHQSLNSRV